MKLTVSCLTIGAAAVLAVSGSVAADAGKENKSEDLSAAYEADLERLAGEHGLADAASTFKQSDSGVLSAVVGVAHMNTLVVRKNDDGTLSFEHVSTGEEFEDFSADTATNEMETEE